MGTALKDERRQHTASKSQHSRSDYMTRMILRMITMMTTTTTCAGDDGGQGRHLAILGCWPVHYQLLTALPDCWRSRRS
jgi:hypothetical protein